MDGAVAGPRGEAYLVCGVDLSKGSRCTAQFAAALARALGLRVVLIQVLAHGASEAACELARERLKAVAADISDVDIARRVERGSPVDVLAEAASGATMVILGSSGRGAIPGPLLGSVSGSLPQRATSPVIMLPAERAESSEAPLRGDAVVCGVRDEQDGAAALLAARLAAALRLRLTLVHVMPAAVAPLLAPAHVPPPGLLDRPGGEDAAMSLLHLVAAEVSRHVPREAHLRVLEGRPGVRLADAAAREAAALIVVGRSEHGRVRGALIGSPARHLIRRGCCPVVICPAPDVRQALHGFARAARGSS